MDQLAVKIFSTSFISPHIEVSISQESDLFVALWKMLKIRRLSLMMVLRFHMGCWYGLPELVHRLLFALWISLNLLVEGCSCYSKIKIVAFIFFPLTNIANLKLAADFCIDILFGSVLSGKQDHICLKILCFNIKCVYLYTEKTEFGINKK